MSCSCNFSVMWLSNKRSSPISCWLRLIHWLQPCPLPGSQIVHHVGQVSPHNCHNRHNRHNCHNPNNRHNRHNCHSQKLCYFPLKINMLLICHDFPNTTEQSVFMDTTFYSFQKHSIFVFNYYNNIYYQIFQTRGKQIIYHSLLMYILQRV